MPQVKKLKTVKRKESNNNDLFKELTTYPRYQRATSKPYRKETKLCKSKVAVSIKQQKERDAILSQPKNACKPKYNLSKKRYTSSYFDQCETVATAYGDKQAKTEPWNEVESEPEIKLTHFVPTKIYLKKEVKQKAMQAVNHTVTTMSPTGKVVSRIKICSSTSCLSAISL